MIPGYTVRLSRRADMPQLPRIEREAMLRFVDYEQELGFRADAPAAPNSPDTLLAAHADGRLWVAADAAEQPVGFALVLDLGLFAHLEELVVLPAQGGQGLGGALLEAVCAWADSRGYSAVTLATYRDVPWNAPFCARHSFAAIAPEDLPPELEQVMASLVFAAAGPALYSRRCQFGALKTSPPSSAHAGALPALHWISCRI
jgi:4-diphosphocytidyl-2-C-methyl-D-erythritol kinase